MLTLTYEDSGQHSSAVWELVEYVASPHRNSLKYPRSQTLKSYPLSSLEMEAEGSRVQSQPLLHREF